MATLFGYGDPSLVGTDRHPTAGTDLTVSLSGGVTGVNPKMMVAPVGEDMSEVLRAKAA